MAGVLRAPGHASGALSGRFATEDSIGCVKLFVEQDPDFHSESRKILETATDENASSSSIGSHKTPAEQKPAHLVPNRRFRIGNQSGAASPKHKGARINDGSEPARTQNEASKV